jgi:PAS domain S-box-containing protein
MPSSISAFMFRASGMSLSRLGRILEESSNEIYVFDAETCRFVQVNRGARDNLGYSMDELRGLTAWDIKPSLDEQSFRAMVEPLRSGEQDVLRFETEHCRKDGTLYPVEVRLQLFDAENPPVFVAIIQDISERKQAAELNERLGRILESSANEIYVFDAGTCRFLQVNRGARDNLGYSMDELRGLTAWDIKPSLDEPSFRAMVEPLRSGEEDVLVFETEHRRKDSTLYPVEVRLQLYGVENPPVFVAIIQDISERKQSEEALVVREQYIRGVLENVVDGVVTIGADGTVESFNPSAEALFGYSAEEMIGENVRVLMPEPEYSAHDGYLRAYQETGRAKIIGVGPREVTGKRKNGSLFPIELAVVDMLMGERRVFIGTMRDITQRKAAEAEIRNLNEDLEQRVYDRTKELEAANNSLTDTLETLRSTQSQLVEAEKMASLGGLVAGVAHEINTPIGLGVTAASYLQEKSEGLASRFRAGKMKRSDLEAFLDLNDKSSSIILSNLDRASELIRSFKQVAVDQSSEERRLFNVGDSIHELLLSLGPKLRKTQHRIEVDCPDELTIEGYPGAVSQIVTNLVMNTLIHAYDDGKAGTIRIEVARPNGKVELHYSDDGKGIPREHMGQIFDPFFTTKRGEGGSGLGLNILYNLATQTLGGTITCSSETGKGTEFFVSFPVTNGESA